MVTFNVYLASVKVLLVQLASMWIDRTDEGGTNAREYARASVVYFFHPYSASGMFTGRRAATFAENLGTEHVKNACGASTVLDKGTPNEARKWCVQTHREKCKTRKTIALLFSI